MELMRELDSGVWAEIVPAHCPCRGGWLLSDHDTWHRCPIHGKHVPHPEDDEAVFDHQAHRVAMHRAAWRELQVRSGMGKAEFRGTVGTLYAGIPPWGMSMQAFEETRTLIAMNPNTPEMWVGLAYEVARAAWTERAENEARRAGFSCRLEASLAEQAQEEAQARRENREPRHLPSQWHF